jgi:hypothetical protein
LPIDPTWKEWLTLVQILFLQPALHSLPGLLCDLELNGSARLLLQRGRSGPHTSTECHIIDAERD